MKTKSLFFDWTSYIILFLAPAIMGYLWEVILYLLYYRDFYNRGFTYGPWLTVYGLGGLLFYFLLHRHTHRKPFCFLMCSVIGSGLELIVGLLIRYLLGFRYWDYSHWPLNLGGYICLFSALFFGLFGMLWVCVLCPKLLTFWKTRLKQKKRSTLALLLSLCYCFDFIYALFFPNQGNGISYSVWSETFFSFF